MRFLQTTASTGFILTSNSETGENYSWKENYVSVNTISKNLTLGEDLSLITGGIRNINIGYQSGKNNIFSYDSISIGNQSLMNANRGNKNICIGNGSGKNIISSTDNIIMGVDSGLNLSDAGCRKNIIIGNGSGGFTGGAGGRNIVIGNTSCAQSDYVNVGDKNTVVGDNNIPFGTNLSNNTIVGNENVNANYLGVYDNIILGKNNLNQLK